MRGEGHDGTEGVHDVGYDELSGERGDGRIKTNAERADISGEIGERDDGRKNSERERADGRGEIGAHWTGDSDDCKQYTAPRTLCTRNIFSRVDQD